jgi:uncharacterized protein (DUF885 family)
MTLAIASPARAAVPPSDTLRTLLESEWEWELKEFPEHATSLGDHRFDDRVTDRSPAAIAARRAHHAALLNAVRAIDRSQLQGEDRISRDVLEFTADLSVQGDTLYRGVAPDQDLPFSSDDSPFVMNQMSGPQLSLPQLVRATRFQTEADYQHYLARLAQLPTVLEQQKALLEAGRHTGLLPPRVAIARMPSQFGPLLNEDLNAQPLYAPFLNFPASISQEAQSALKAKAADLLNSRIRPALRALQEYLATTYVPAAPEQTGASHLPHGEAIYAWSLQRYNTTRMTAKEIHDLGLREVARIDAAMLAVMQEAGFKGTLAEFRTYLRTDKSFQYGSAEEELAALRDVAKRIDPQLPSLFVELPRLPYGVRPMSKEEGNNAPHYISGAIDGSRAGYFEANTNNLAAWPKWTMDALVLHEAVPGHHLQIARAQELTSLPKWRRAYGNSGFSEGWGLYAEGLGSQLGLYADPYTRFGRLTMEAHRAARLVVDTGMHAFGWTRERAIDYLVDHAQLDRGFAEAEVDRYLVWPGQATAYKVGEQKILALRHRAETTLGAKFDVRRFHNAVIDHGGLPLTVLDQVIEEWTAGEQSRTN